MAQSDGPCGTCRNRPKLVIDEAKWKEKTYGKTGNNKEIKSERYGTSPIKIEKMRNVKIEVIEGKLIGSVGLRSVFDTVHSVSDFGSCGCIWS